ncbi:unnamed protein product [Danaus chrysippus]|uniref:(African queen) hypothetical protein n=1 Tax=Danaus chrysippus TaxID=151541 RepID=A0A8J2R622_9NEOP|nr:unnamed protein product [Danaus chrysippus]
MLMSDVPSFDFPCEDLPQRLPLNENAHSSLFSQSTVVRPDEVPSGNGATSLWSTDGRMNIIEFTKTQELLVPAPSDPFVAFRLLLDDNILDLIVHETNVNANRVLQAPGFKKYSRITAWKELTRAELLTFPGLVLHTGTIRLNRLSDYWKKHLFLIFLALRNLCHAIASC